MTAIKEQRSENDRTTRRPNSVESKESTTRKHHLPTRRRRMKSALYFAYRTSSVVTMILIFSATLFSAAQAFSSVDQSGLSQRKQAWITRSVEYYSTVMRQNREKTSSLDSSASSSSGPMELVDPLTDKNFVELATKHYYARFLIKNGKLTLAEKIYRRIIDELEAEEEHCDNTKLAVSTLLLALHMQRFGDVKATRAVFVNFFRRVALTKEDEDEVQCSCSGRVLQAYALFEMKNGHSAKSLEIIQKAVKMDEALKPVLEWKQFRDAAAGKEYEPVVNLRRKRVEKKSTSSRDELRP